MISHTKVVQVKAVPNFNAIPIHIGHWVAIRTIKVFTDQKRRAVVTLSQHDQ